MEKRPGKSRDASHCHQIDTKVSLLAEAQIQFGRGIKA
jgi:hypothetical protein